MDYNLARESDQHKLADDLNALLRGKKLVVTELDTADGVNAKMKTGYYAMWSHEFVAIRQFPGLPQGSYYLDLPIGLGIKVPLQVFEIGGKVYSSFIDVNGDMVIIRVAIGTDDGSNELNFHHYSITAYGTRE